MKIVLAGLIVAGFTVLVPAVARAAAGTVFYKDGGQVSGEIVEVRPGKFVVVKTATGEARRIEWAEVDHVADASTPAPSAAVLGPGVDDSEAATIIIRSTAPATVVQEVTGQATAQGYSGAGSVRVHTTMYKDLCTAPCSYKLKLGINQLMASAAGFPMAFTQLELHRGDNFLLAKMGSGPMTLSGYLMTSVGVIGIIVGGTLLLLKGIDSSPSASIAPGLGILLGSAALTGGGITLIALGSSTIVPDPDHLLPGQSSGLPLAQGVALTSRF